MKHPFRDYTTEQALELARQCKFGPLPRDTNPTPTMDEAIEIIRNHPTMKACNWITGQVAIEVLRLERGEEVEFL
ncbi:MAG: hypothetical protein WCJ63_08425 [Actinomycetes bacterium]